MPDLSHFNLDNEVKTTFEIGDLIPFSWLDVVPGDEIKQSLSAVIRLQPLVAPVMDGLKFYSRFYYVPYRLLMKDFERMLIDPDSPLVAPTLYDVLDSLPSAFQYDMPILKDYNLLRCFGIHSDDGHLSSNSMKLISAFPFLAYQLIYNYFYKDPVLDPTYRDAFDPSMDFDFDGIFKIRKVRYLSDYFTSSMPNTQYGSEVSLDMDGNNVIKVNEMRLAEKLQLFKEKLLLHGARYLDYLKTFFDSAPTSQVLQQPQYLGGGSDFLNISDIDQVVSNDDAPIGNVAGKSASVVGDNGYKEIFKEHGIVLGLGFIKPGQSYVSGIPRSFIKRDFYSFYNPTFSNIGMQEVYGAELSANRSDTFGYNERYAELKYNPSVVCGDFAESLHYWHFGRDVRNRVLNNDFLLVDYDNSAFSVPGVRFDYRSTSDASLYVLKSGSSYKLAIGPSGLDSDFFGDDLPIVSSFAFGSHRVLFHFNGSITVVDRSNSNFPNSIYLDWMNFNRGYGYPIEMIFSHKVDFSSLPIDNIPTLPSDYDIADYFKNWFVSPDFKVASKGSVTAIILPLNWQGRSALVHGGSSGYKVEPVPGGIFNPVDGNSLDALQGSLPIIVSDLVGSEMTSSVFNHCLASFRNNIEALRPVPKSDRFLI